MSYTRRRKAFSKNKRFYSTRRRGGAVDSLPEVNQLDAAAHNAIATGDFKRVAAMLVLLPPAQAAGPITWIRRELSASGNLQGMVVFANELKAAREQWYANKHYEIIQMMRKGMWANADKKRRAELIKRFGVEFRNPIDQARRAMNELNQARRAMNEFNQVSLYDNAESSDVNMERFEAARAAEAVKAAESNDAVNDAVNDALAAELQYKITEFAGDGSRGFKNVADDGSRGFTNSNIYELKKLMALQPRGGTRKPRRNNRYGKVKPKI